MVRQEQCKSKKDINDYSLHVTKHGLNTCHIRLLSTLSHQPATSHQYIVAHSTHPLHVYADRVVVSKGGGGKEKQ